MRFNVILRELDVLFDSDSEFEIFRIKHNNLKKIELKNILLKMNPYKFELLIEGLFNAMGYNAEVTKRSNDMGVDIVATLEISGMIFKEVIQVKRQANNIHRPVLDQLRGVMPIHDAKQGSIVTLGDFSKNCYNLAPENIRLINGDKLIDFLFKYEVAFIFTDIKTCKVDYDFLDSLIVS